MLEGHSSRQADRRSPGLTSYWVRGVGEGGSQGTSATEGLLGEGDCLGAREWRVCLMRGGILGEHRIH